MTPEEKILNEFLNGPISKITEYGRKHTRISIATALKAISEAKEEIDRLKEKNIQLLKWQKINRDQYERAEELQAKLERYETALKHYANGTYPSVAQEALQKK